MERKIPLKGKITKEHPFFFPLIFLALALISVLGLDFVAWEKGKESYLFGAFAKRKVVIAERETLDKIILEKLAELGIPADSIDKYEDSEGVFHLLVDLDLEKYRKLEAPLEKKFRKEKASVSKKEEQKTAEKDFYLWEIEGKKKQKIVLLFACPKEAAKAEEKPPIVVAKKKVAIIIDDMGYSLRAVKEISSIKKPLTIAVIPFSPLDRETAQIAHQNGLEVILHLPLEPLNNQEGNNNTEGMIHSGMEREDVIKTINRSLEQVPHVQGVNNHMGSKITSDEIFMRIILERLKERKLFFVDSRTTRESVAFKVAQTLGVPSAYRNIFLDIENDEGYIKKKMIDLFELAQKKGMAVAICHPTKVTLKVLKENFHLIDEYNLEPVFASQIVR